MRTINLQILSVSVSNFGLSCRRAKRLLPLAVLLTLNLAAHAGVGYWHYYSDPQNYNVGCGVDDAFWDNVSAAVAADAIPGDYGFKRFGGGVSPDVVIRVNSDGTWGYVGGLGEAFGYSQCTSQSQLDSTFSVTSAPTGGVATISGEAMLYGGIIHDAPAVCGGGVHGFVRITVGNVPPAIAGTNDKPNDAKTCPNPGPASGPPPRMARYSANLSLASLNIEDTPFGYAPARGPAVDFKVSYSQRQTTQPTTFTYSNLGPNWTFNWLSYVTDNPADGTATAGVYVPGGGLEAYTGFNSATQSYAADAQSHAVLVRMTSSTYEKRFPDGSKHVFSLSDGAISYPRKIFMTQVVDPTGNAVSIGYDGSFRVTSLTDALGYVTTIAYEDPNDSLKITKLTEPFATGRTATFAYTNGQLTTITDEIGIQSVLHYATGTNFIDSLTTPYGTSSFATGQNGTNTWIEMTDPLGGKERVEYRDLAPNIGPAESAIPTATGITNSGLNIGNSFYWDKKAIQMYPPNNGVYDYTKARITHWAYNADGSLSGIAASEKAPLENRVWYTYIGQSDSNHVSSSARPSQIARVLDDGTTQLHLFLYNSLGRVTQSTDPLGRVLSFDYDPNNNIDLLTIRQTKGANNELLRTFTYNAQHEPLTDKDQAGQTTTYGYNSYGQLTSVQDAKLQTTAYGYGDGTVAPIGYLASITSPQVNGASAVTNLAYDSANRVRTITNNPDGYTVTVDYDNLDRRTQITYPDGTFEQFKYTEFDDSQTDTGKKLLDLTKSIDRRGYATYRHYDSNRHMDWTKDPLLRKTIFSWCSCGSLTGITDANNHTTTFNRDLQSRLSSRVFADTKSITYTYEGTTSRLKSMTDAKNQMTNYQYFADDTLKQFTYTDTAQQPLNPATPTTSFTYDPNYNRVATMTDGTGLTTYTYKPIIGSASLGAGMLQNVDGPLANDTITYTYDELGRRLSESINGATASSQTYDTLGRVNSATNPLSGVSSFAYSYDGPTSRLQSVTLASGPSTTYSYFNNTGGRRLQTILNTKSGGTTLSRFDYVYDAEGEITSLTKQLGATGFPETWTATSPSTSMLDAADQLTNLTDHPSADVFASTSFGYDNVGNQTDGSFHSFNSVNQLTDAGYAYDNGGNLTADPFRTYEWDAANRLTAINYTGIGSRTEFTYDGLGRRVKIVEKDFSLALDVQIQPPTKQYTQYGPFNFTAPVAASYKLTLQGLNPNGGDNVVLMDTVQLNGTNLTNGGFETPALSAGTYQYRPTSATWTFVGNSGVSRANTVMSPSAQPTPPGGSQVGFLQSDGSVTQTISAVSGSNNVKLKAAQRATNNASFQVIHLTLQTTTLSVMSTKQFIWSGSSIAEERDANNNVTRRFYPQGEQISGVSFYYSRDHLGSVNELTDTSGSLRAEYSYDWWGNRTKESGDLDASFGFTGYYSHAKSGLNLALYRAYDAGTARWISRDPLSNAEMNQGPNLYGYVGNNPINSEDKMGLDAVPWYAAGDYAMYFYLSKWYGNAPNDADYSALSKGNAAYFDEHSPVRGGFAMAGVQKNFGPVEGEALGLAGWDIENGGWLGALGAAGGPNIAMGEECTTSGSGPLALVDSHSMLNGVLGGGAFFSPGDAFGIFGYRDFPIGRSTSFFIGGGVTLSWSRLHNFVSPSYWAGNMPTH